MRKDPTEFRKRFAKWKETGEYELPRFEGGEEKFKLKKTPEFVQAGKDNSWSKVTNDNMGTVFQEVVARPNSTGGNTSAGSLKKQWEPKYEKPLEIVSPEFEILTGVRPMTPSLHGVDRKAYQFARKMSIDKSKMQNVQDAFRNSEWNNFLSTKNGDYYYRMAKTAENGTRSAGENYFISHTTPWEEFAGMNIGAPDASALTGEVKNGIQHLYEFPTKTFGQLKSSSWEGVLGDTNVSTMGKKHLLFGNTSSGSRGPVRVLSDKNAEYLGTSPYKLGISERPTVNGMYDKSPVYEDIHMGNQTVISGDKLNSALNNTTYNHYYPVQGGIQKELHVAQKKTSTPTQISWKDAQKTTVRKTSFPTYKTTEENAAKITPEQWTAAQDAAIARGDMAEAQRLRDLHFKVNAPNTQIVDKNGNPLHTYHGGQKGITAFLNPNEFDTSIKLNNYYKDGRNRIGIYTFDWKSYAKQYARGYKKKDRDIYDLYVNMENPRYISYLESKLNQLRNLNPFRKKDYLNPSVIRPEHKEQLLDGYDGVKWDIENAVFDGKQLKSADAVTFDDNGVRIPLGLRDNFNINDIRYGIIPLISGSTGYGLYNKYAE